MKKNEIEQLTEIVSQWEKDANKTPPAVYSEYEMGQLDCAIDIRELLKTIKPDEDEWQSIETAKTPSSKSILVHCPERHNTYVVYHNGKWMHFGGLRDLNEEPKFWRPLPPAPETSKE